MIEKWYDGYEYSGRKVFNPWSLLNAIRGLVNGLGENAIKPYWGLTSGNDIIDDMIDKIMYLFNNEDKIKELGKNARNFSLNYTSDIVIDESYFFGEDKKYSIMNYLIYELHLIEQNIFSIYKNKFILGGINEEINNKIKYCKTRDKIEESFIYFFWNCDIESIYIGNIYKSNNIKISLLIDSLLKDYIISTKDMRISNRSRYCTRMRSMQ